MDAFDMANLKMKALNPLQEQVLRLGKCPFCKTKLAFDFKVKDFVKVYSCEECVKNFWIDWNPEGEEEESADT